MERSLLNILIKVEELTIALRMNIYLCIYSLHKRKLLVIYFLFIFFRFFSVVCSNFVAYMVHMYLFVIMCRSI